MLSNIKKSNNIKTGNIYKPDLFLKQHVYCEYDLNNKSLYKITFWLRGKALKDK